MSNAMKHIEEEMGAHVTTPIDKHENLKNIGIVSKNTIEPQTPVNTTGVLEIGQAGNNSVTGVVVPSMAKDRLKKKKMTKSEKEKALTMFFLIPGLIPSGFHIILYGAAGSGKTTVVLFLMREILLNNKDVEVYYLYLDGQISMAATYEDYIEGEELSNRYNILTGGTADELLIDIEALVEESENPSNIVIVLDTFKYLNTDTLNKSGNAKALHRIKALTNKGVTFITLHHTNKDGENYAGTAEIEQDSDALLKIETTDGVGEHEKISTIIEGGRVRYFMEPMSFTFTRGMPSSVEILTDKVDTSLIQEEKKDIHIILIIKGVLTKQGSITKTNLEKLVKEDDGYDGSDKELKKILQKYLNKHWGIKKSGDRSHVHNYSVIDTTAKTIESIQAQLSSPKKGE